MKLRIILSAFVVFFLIKPINIYAQSCEKSLSSCFSGSGQPAQCTPPCIRVITQQGGPRGGEAQCACKLPNQQHSIPLGANCQKDNDCAPPGQYCWGSLNGVPICHIESHTQSIQSNIPAQVKVCDFAGDKQGECDACMGQGDKAWTAIGCIDTKPEPFIKQLIGFGGGIAGGIALLLILFGGFQIMTSTGNPEKLNAGRELVTSAVTGLLLVILSIFLLRVIGVDIIGIPGFG